MRIADRKVERTLCRIGGKTNGAVDGHTETKTTGTNHTIKSMTLRLAVVFVLFFALGCSNSGSDLGYLNLDAEYVGKEACASCHPDKFQTYVESQMGRSWTPATLANSAADFDDPDPIYDDVEDLYYQALSRGDSLYILEFRLAGQDTVHKRMEKIDYIVGSGHHTNSHIMDVNGYLYQMPMTWYVQSGQWDLPPGFKDGNSARFDRPIVSKCITCHNGMPEIVEGSYNKYENVPHGIGCERCHGAGSVHVEAMLAGNVVNVAEEIDYTIVNPAKLPVDLQFNICQGCHVQGAAVPKPGKAFADFRPGMSLTSIENVFWPRFADSLTQFVMASHPDRLTQSECFRQTTPEKPLTCITCHDPHVPIEALGREHYDSACMSCHESAAVEEIHPEPITNSCVSCHMPASGSSDIPHVQITDHLIRVPDSVRATVVTGGTPTGAEFIRMASLLDPSPNEREIAEGYLTYYEEVTNYPGFLDSAATYLRIAETNSSLGEVAAPLIRMHYLAHNYEAVTRIAREIEEVPDAWTAYRIGDSYLSTGNPGASLSYLEDAVSRSPKRLDFKRRLASNYAHNGNFVSALLQLDEVLAANPKFADAYSDRGMINILTDRIALAEEDFIDAIALDPDHQTALANLASLYYNTQRLEEARPLVQRLLALDGSNMQYYQLWRLVE